MIFFYFLFDVCNFSFLFKVNGIIIMLIWIYLYDYIVCNKVKIMKFFIIEVDYFRKE